MGVKVGYKERVEKAHKKVFERVFFVCCKNAKLDDIFEKCATYRGR
jgi:hypothetical protein